MELCQEVHDGLSLAGNRDRVDDDAFAKLIAECDRMAGDEVSQCLSKQMTGESKLAVVSMMALLVEAAKNNLTESQLTAVIESDGHLKARAKSTVECYGRIKTRLRQRLAQQRLEPNGDLPKMVDCRWSQDYLIRTNNRHRCAEVEYLIKLVTDKPIESGGGLVKGGDDDGLVFTASLQELQDMTAKLREAGKIVERVVSKSK